MTTKKTKQKGYHQSDPNNALLIVGDHEVIKTTGIRFNREQIFTSAFSTKISKWFGDLSEVTGQLDAIRKDFTYCALKRHSQLDEPQDYIFFMEKVIEFFNELDESGFF